ncbi:uncharacterized protein TNCV_251311 [Trichonephila clavipes]|nr:uncharacterized protein TNCV_251311 [Trichonephila clavipes]
MDAYPSNEWKSVNQNDFVQYFEYSKQYSLLESIYNANGQVTSLQWQDEFQLDEPNSLFECSFAIGACTALRQERVQKHSLDSRCTLTACVALLGMDSINIDFLSQSIDSLFLEIPASDFNFFDSQGVISVLKDELLATNFGSSSESSCEYVELSNSLFKPDFSVESLKSSSSYMNSNTFIEDHNFQTEVKSM